MVSQAFRLLQPAHYSDMLTESLASAVDQEVGSVCLLQARIPPDSNSFSVGAIHPQLDSDTGDSELALEPTKFLDALYGSVGSGLAKRGFSPMMHRKFR